MLLEEGKKLKALFEKLRKEKNISRKKFAEIHKIPGGDALIYQHIKGIRPISLAQATTYAKNLNCNIEDISQRLADEAEESISLTASHKISQEPAKYTLLHHPRNVHFNTAPLDSVTFNVLDVRAVCGSGAINSDYPETIKTLVMSLSEANDLFGTANRNGRIKIITAHKDSMTPTIIPGDVLFVDTLVNEFVGEAVYILLHGGELICKRLSIVGKTLTVSSDNNVYPSWPWEDRDEQTRIVGKVIPVVWRKVRL